MTGRAARRASRMIRKLEANLMAGEAEADPRWDELRKTDRE